MVRRPKPGPDSPAQVAAQPSEVTWAGVPLSPLVSPRPGQGQAARGPSNPRTVWPGNREAGSALRRPPGPFEKYRADGTSSQLLGALAGPSVPWTAIAASFPPLLTLHVAGTVLGAGRWMTSEARHRPGTVDPPRPRPDVPGSHPADARGRMTLGHGVVLCPEGSLAASLASPTQMPKAPPS